MFPLVFFRWEEYDHEHEASRRGSDSKETGLFMYARIKFGVKLGFSTSCETCLKIVLLTFKEQNVWLQRERGSFCNIWHISCAPMSLSAMVYVRSFRMTTPVGASGRALCDSRNSIWW